MANMMEQVREFMIAMDQEMGDTIKFRAELLRIRLITEEANETAQAIYGQDMVKAVDGLCDQLYVVLGTFVAFGFTPEQVGMLFNEVHRSNMAKTGGGLDTFGKVRKPANWTPPNIKGLLNDMMCEYYVEIISQSDVYLSGPHPLEYCNDMIAISPMKEIDGVNMSIKRRQIGNL